MPYESEVPRPAAAKASPTMRIESLGVMLKLRPIQRHGDECVPVAWMLAPCHPHRFVRLDRFLAQCSAERVDRADLPALTRAGIAGNRELDHLGIHGAAWGYFLHAQQFPF